MSKRLELAFECVSERCPARARITALEAALRDLAIHDGIHEPTYRNPWMKAAAALAEPVPTDGTTITLCGHPVSPDGVVSGLNG